MSGDPNPTVSVIIPAYRAAATIGRAVGSALAQTRPPQEVLVIDDGSPDDLAAALAPFGDRVRHVRKANGGAASARNHGIDCARGELIAFLDADDYWELDKLECQLAVLARHPEVGLVASHFFMEEPGRPRCPGYPLRLPTDQVLRPEDGCVLRVANSIWTSALLARRAVVGELRFDTSLRTAEDVDLWIRLARRAPAYLIARPLATAVLVAGSLSRSDIAADSRNMLAVLRRYAGEFPRGELRAWEAKVYRTWAAVHLGDGEPRRAVGPAWRRLCREPLSAQGWWVFCKSVALACKVPFPPSPRSLLTAR